MEEVIIILVCLGINGLFACFEMAFVTVPKPQLRQRARSGNNSAARILVLRENPERTLSVIQVGITLVGMISAAVGGAGAEESFAPYFERTFDMSENSAEAVAIGIVVLPLTILSVILGELVPKAIALKDPLRASLFGARWIGIIDRCFSPLVSFLEAATRSILYFLPKRGKSSNVDHVASVDIDHLSQQTQQYVLNLVGIESRRAKDVMVPWLQVNSIKESDPVSEITAAVIRFGHTRLPVCRGQEPIGILHTKEFIALLSTAPETWQTIVRPLITVSENEPVLRMLRLMQERRSHISVVLSKDRHPLGIVTLEDILEEVVGDIYDEDDDGRIRKLLISQSRVRTRPFRGESSE